ncbi:Hypothetical predicted protein [Pelobates cultripes]|uniref:Uncharacterized protein n=1 Tax=Pelobates cultripes TaxID=61616 RepID=A0AAD1RX49_PELCU|nr:Hypothetical predicted protein [Pelobates cultripes]
MVARPYHYVSSSKKELLDAPDPIQGAVHPEELLQSKDRGAQATKGDIMNLMVHIHTFFHANLAVVQEELMAVTDRVKAMEKDVSSLSQHQADVVEQIRHLQASHKAIQARLETMDDARLCNNLKI